MFGCIESGIKVLDNDHEQFFHQLKILESQLAEKNDDGSYVSLVALLGYMDGHFRNEIKMMEKVGYPKQLMDEHEEAHSKMKDYLFDHVKSRQQCNIDLSKWMNNHIDSHDKKLASYILEKNEIN